MKNTKKLTLCAILSALTVVILFFASVFSAVDLTITAAAMFLQVFAVIEIKGKYPFLIYAVSSILALLLLPQKFCAVCYAAFIGYYPIIKVYLDRLPLIFSWLAKLAVFNAAYTVGLLICRAFLPEIDSQFDAFIYALGNVAFILIDIVISQATTIYIYKLRKKYNIKKILK